MGNPVGKLNMIFILYSNANYPTYIPLKVEFLFNYLQQKTH